MSNPYPAEFVLHFPGENPQTVGAEEFAGLLRRGGVPEKISLSVKESRQRVKFNQVERFISAQLDFSNTAMLVNAVKDPSQRKWAREWALQIIEEDTLMMEDKMAFWMEAMFGKASVQNFMRSQDNPWVRGGNVALQGARLAGLVASGSETQG